ncbi:MAG: GIN domain-containing protein [Cyclobacteriaceae bacterium]
MMKPKYSANTKKIIPGQVSLDKTGFNQLMKTRYILIIILACLSCKKDNCLNSTGKTTKLERITGPFHSIQVKDIFDLVLTQDSSTFITIEGGANLLPFISTNVKDCVLILDNDLDCRWAREYGRIKVHVHLVETRDLILDTPCNVKTTNHLDGYEIRFWPVADLNEADLQLNCTRFFLKSSYTANGIIKLRGKVDFVNLIPFGTMEIDASQLIGNKVEVSHYSNNKVTVYPVQYLKAWLYGPGNLYYNNIPAEIIPEINSTGKILFKE